MECLADLEFLIPLPQLPDTGVTGVCLQVRLTFLFFLEPGELLSTQREQHESSDSTGRRAEVPTQKKPLGLDNITATKVTRSCSPAPPCTGPLWEQMIHRTNTTASSCSWGQAQSGWLPQSPGRALLPGEEQNGTGKSRASSSNLEYVWDVFSLYPPSHLWRISPESKRRQTVC